MKILTTAFLISLSIISVTRADDTFAIDIQTLKQEALNRAHAQKIDYFHMLDFDGNGKLSKTECSGSSDGFEAIPFFDKEELIEIKKKIDNAFDDFDTNKDGYLDRDEATPYFSFIENIGLATQTNKIDINNDGQVTEDEMSQYMKTMPSMEDSMAKLEELTTKMENINKNPEQFTNNFISHTHSSIINEQFIQMDSDKNDQVTQQEYTTYMYSHPNNKELGFTKDDYNNMYNLIDTNKKGYITQQEYSDYQQKQLKNALSYTDSPQSSEEIFEKITQETCTKLFTQMDTDENNQVTLEEFSKYTQQNHSQSSFSQEEITKEYQKIDINNQGFFSLPEYIEYTKKENQELALKDQEETLK